ncbi:NAD(P)-dependent alcohol dehydrogenase [Steroidobacter sp.]|uniref:NAD(P)-dependent alcohol dehydrogenase n=1 Tax=Steroidobacter sp. TaxID=1978227 RepID=UPI001A539082|nr:NAD(P)-dependent alcohol dehydrogenase [Steroidobacter sp.]MBL8265350.1 NAD(P)-dependent alcohol dehydrogenase [Steroidobacter sp.]
MDIQAAVIREKGGAFNLERVELAEPAADEVQIKIVASGMCHTDLAVRDQHIPLPLPAVLGHEGAGVVTAVGRGVTKVKPGDHVVLSYGSCGQCGNCLAGRPAYCAQFLAYNVGTRRPDGSCTHSKDGQPMTGCFFYQSSFATHALTHVRNIVKVDKDLPLEVLAPLGCGIQTGAGAVLNCLRPSAGSSIAVFGAGAVGLSAVMAAAVAGCSRIIAIDMQDSRLQLARELGATHVVNAKAGNAVEQVKAATGGAGADFAVEATGIPAVMTQAFDALNGTGTVVVLGVAPAGATVSVDISSLLNGKTLRGAIEGESVPDIFIPRLIELWQAGKFPFDRLAKFYSFEHINEAAEDSERGTTIKPVIRFPA